MAVCELCKRSPRTEGVAVFHFTRRGHQAAWLCLDCLALSQHNLYAEHIVLLSEVGPLTLRGAFP